MKNYVSKHIRENEETGEKEYFYPMELSDETEKEFKGAIKHEGFEVAMTRLGNRKFKAVMVPVTREQYYDLVKDELNRQEEDKQRCRCIISNGNGKIKRCPMRVPNPNYVEGGSEPKTLPVKCSECEFYNNDKSAPGFLNFSSLDREDEGGETISFDPKSDDTYNQGGKYESIKKEWVEFVKERKPKLTELAELLSEEYIQSEAARILNKSTSTIGSQNEKLKELVLEFLDNLIKM